MNGDGGESAGVRRPRPTTQGRVDGARPAPASIGGLTSGAGLRFHANFDCEGALLRGGFRSVTGGLSGGFGVALDLEVGVLCDHIKVIVGVNENRPVFYGGRGDEKIRHRSGDAIASQ